MRACFLSPGSLMWRLCNVRPAVETPYSNPSQSLISGPQELTSSLRQEVSLPAVEMSASYWEDQIYKGEAGTLKSLSVSSIKANAVDYPLLQNLLLSYLRYRDFLIMFLKPILLLACASSVLGFFEQTWFSTDHFVVTPSNCTLHQPRSWREFLLSAWRQLRRLPSRHHNSCWRRLVQHYRRFLRHLLFSPLHTSFK